MTGIVRRGRYRQQANQILVRVATASDRAALATPREGGEIVFHCCGFPVVCYPDCDDPKMTRRTSLKAM